jgi:hypothetical protein
MVPGYFGITVFYLVLPAMLIVGAVIAGPVATPWQMVDLDWCLLAERLGVTLVHRDIAPSGRPGEPYDLRLHSVCDSLATVRHGANC